MTSIPQSRLILYVMIAGLLPIFFAIAHFISKNNELEELRNHIQQVQDLALIRERKQSLNMIVREHYSDADHFYIDKHLEKLTFLEPEIDSLQKVVNNKNFAGDETVKKRLEFLTGSSNALLFSESNVQTYPFFTEITHALVHPVELNTADLQKILVLIEGISIGPYNPAPNRPQLLILDFKIDRKESTDRNDVFLLNMKLLKREYPS